MSRREPLVIVCPECRQLRQMLSTGCACPEHGKVIQCTPVEYDEALREYYARKSMLERRIIRRCRKVVRNCDDAIIEAEMWNSLNADKQPVDVEDFRVMRAKCASVLAQLNASVYE